MHLFLDLQIDHHTNRLRDFILQQSPKSAPKEQIILELFANGFAQKINDDLIFQHLLDFHSDYHSLFEATQILYQTNLLDLKVNSMIELDDKLNSIYEMAAKANDPIHYLFDIWAPNVIQNARSSLSTLQIKILKKRLTDLKQSRTDWQTSYQIFAIVKLINDRVFNGNHSDAIQKFNQILITEAKKIHTIQAGFYQISIVNQLFSLINQPILKLYHQHHDQTDPLPILSINSITEWWFLDHDYLPAVFNDVHEHTVTNLIHAYQTMADLEMKQNNLYLNSDQKYHRLSNYDRPHGINKEKFNTVTDFSVLTEFLNHYWIPVQSKA